MAKSNYSFTCIKCGNAAGGQVTGYNRADADRKADWMAGQPRECGDCWRASSEAARQAANTAESEQAIATNLAAGLPTLDGTPKQIAWAESVRAKALAAPGNRVMRQAPATQEVADKLGLSLDDLAARRREMDDVFIIARDGLERQTSAKWWIDNRDDVDGHVRRAFEAAKARLSADVAARQAAEKAAHDAAEKVEREAHNAAAKAEREAEFAATTVKAQSFRVGAHRADEAVIVEVERDNIKVRSTDGRTALGFIDGGEWAIYQIGDHALSATHPEMKRIAREARQAWEDAR